MLLYRTDHTGMEKLLDAPRDSLILVQVLGHTESGTLSPGMNSTVSFIQVFLTILEFLPKLL